MLLPVEVALKFAAPFIHCMLPVSISDPYSFTPPFSVGLLAAPVQFMLWQNADAKSTVIVQFVDGKEFASKKTLSNGLGMQLPPLPPLLVDQWFVSLQLPVPFTQ